MLQRAWKDPGLAPVLNLIVGQAMPFFAAVLEIALASLHRSSPVCSGSVE